MIYDILSFFFLNDHKIWSRFFIFLLKCFNCSNSLLPAFFIVIKLVHITTYENRKAMNTTK